MQVTLESPASHLRRLPAHLSVSLRHGRHSCNTNLGDGQGVQKGQNVSTRPSAARQLSDDSSDSGDSSGMTADQWFEHSNKRPGVGVQSSLHDDEPPYFLPQNSSTGSSRESLHDCVDASRLQSRDNQSEISESRSSGYRSIIDDLTIENKELKERLRKYQSLHSPYLEKDRLFELKIHGLASKKRRELEDLLRTFASSCSESEDGTTSNFKAGSKAMINSYPSALITAEKYPSTLSTSNSRPVDSAYASMSTSGPTSISTENRGRPEPPSKTANEQNIQSFLHDIPEGLLPKHATVMTERQKKKLVVRRLEQLFTGKVDGIVGDHKQPLQQQEVSNLAARADQATKNPAASTEGVREAHICSPMTDLDKPTSADLVKVQSNDTVNTARLSEAGIDDHFVVPKTPEQRPTRPLDLDPDRAQIPSENVDYIRHLGLSTPLLITEDFEDAESDAHGWIYLNLLISLAQLHIINVTPAFVRSSVEDMSSKFQLSHDGRKIRWRGGIEGSRISSDNDSSSAKTQSPHGSDSLDDSNRKRRKLNESNSHNHGRFKCTPQEPARSGTSSKHTNPFHYKPLFNHRTSEDSISFDIEGSDMSYNAGDDTWNSRPGRKWGQRSRSRSSSSQRRQDGPIVFYNGAKFFTDLSGDRGNISTSLHVAGVGKDGYSDHTLDALGCYSRPCAALSRTPSGSLLRFRPFRDYSQQTIGHPIVDPPILTYDSDDNLLDIEPGSKWSSHESSSTPLVAFHASGLGGTQPADHFCITVSTRRTRSHSKPPKPSTPSPFHHNIPTASQNPTDHITSRLSTLLTPPPHLPIKTKTLTTHLRTLPPSQLPAPTGYYSNSSSSEEDSDYNSSSSGLSRFRRSGGYAGSPNDASDDDGSGDGYDEVGSESIDMLAAARELDPETVRAREEEFEIRAAHEQVVGQGEAGSEAATMGGSGSGSGSVETRVSGSSDG